MKTLFMLNEQTHTHKQTLFAALLEYELNSKVSSLIMLSDA